MAIHAVRMHYHQCGNNPETYSFATQFLIFSPPCAHTTDDPSAKDGASSNLYYSEETIYILCNVQAKHFLS